ncbi:MAG: SEC59/DGK1/VTE5 family protein [Elusimicrobia bacterium]|nr:SEC59/DGK1/VTE5 family protein [Elusimicrobiota bacterium]
MSPEFKRKLSHWCILLVPIFYIFLFSRYKVLIILGILIILVVIFELMRQKNEKLNQKYLEMFGDICRAEEINNTSTLVYSLSGIFFTIYFFEKKYALLAIFFLTFGDGFAALVGERCGRHKICRKKSWEGSAANLLACLVTGFLFKYFSQITFLQIILGSVAATIIEILPVKDNLLIPVVSAFVMTLLR